MRRSRGEHDTDTSGGALGPSDGREAAERRRPEGDAERPHGRLEVRCPRCGLGQVHAGEAYKVENRPGLFFTKCDHIFGGCGLVFEYGTDRVFERRTGPWGETYADLMGRPRQQGEQAAQEPRPGAYLEYPGNIVDGCGEADGPEVVSVRQEVRACGCRSRFCAVCGVHLGLRLRTRLVGRISSWPHLQMWTLTVDPLLFDTPAQAFLHVRTKRSVGEFVRGLRKAKVLESGHYFCAFEWQKNTEMTHYHLLVQAKRIPFALACEMWNRNRPIAAGPVVGQRPGFGSLRFSESKFHDGTHAANYVTKYLVKHPEHGFPDWVLDYPGQIRRYSTSMGFWGTRSRRPVEPAAPTKADEQPRAHDPECFCEFCRGDAVEDCDASPEPLTTIRDRLARCGDRAIAMTVVALRYPDGTIRQQFEYRFALPVGMRQFLAGFDGKADDRRSVVLTDAEFEDLAAGVSNVRHAA